MRRCPTAVGPVRGATPVGQRPVSEERTDHPLDDGGISSTLRSSGR